jgi:excisionase family DNA binding protein
MPSDRLGDQILGGLAAADTPSPKTRRVRQRQVGATEHADATRDRFFTISEVASLLAVCDKTVRRWIDDKLLPAHQPRGRGGQIRIAGNDLHAFLDQSRRN